MIDPARSDGQTRANSLSAPQKARLIYDAARNEMATRLWNAALGTDGYEPGGGAANAVARTGIGPFSLDRLLTILASDDHSATKAVSSAPAADASVASTPVGDPTGADRLTAMRDGPNARYVGMLDGAAQRTGIPASALAAIIDAEAAKGAAGGWQPYSRNPRSSAAGLGQFLSGTWESEAERTGSWLNRTAQANGWLDARGRVTAASRSALLALRYDPRASIEAVADYASANVAALRKSGAAISHETAAVAQAAYLGHHLGLSDARRFLAGGLSSDRARKLLGAQLGANAAERRIARAGDAALAHRQWLLDYVGKRIQPSRFA